MGDKVQIALAAEGPSLPLMREFVDQACRAAGVGDQACYDIKLAVEEAAANIIEHGVREAEPASLILSLQAGAREVVVRLTDFGRPFQPAEPPAPSAEAALESGTVGGFGLYLIYRLMDVVTYETGAAGNTLTMTKRLDGDDLTPGRQEVEKGK